MKRLARHIALRTVVACLRLCGLPHGRRGKQRPADASQTDVSVLGFLQTASGLGAAATGICHALGDLSPTPVSMSTLALTAPLPACDALPEITELHSMRGSDVAIHVYNPDVFLAAVRLFGTRFLRANRLNIAVVNWETDVLPPHWTAVLSLYDQLCAPSVFTAGAVARATGRHVHVVPNVVTEKPPRIRPTPHTRFEFLAMFDHHSDVERKNPLATVRAFRSAIRALPAETPCRLRLKCHGSTPAAVIDRLRHEADGAPVEFLNETYGEPQMERLWQECDCFVSLHRSEGFGLPVAEALARSIPVITTRQGGVLDFVDEDGCFFVPGPPALFHPGDTSYPEWSGWIEPDVATAASQMLAVVNGYDAAVARARRGRQRLATVTCRDAVREALQRVLSEAVSPSHPA